MDAIAFRKSSKPHADGTGERWVEDDKTNTLNTFEFHSEFRTPELICEIVYPIDQHQQDSRFRLLGENDPVPTLNAHMGTGGNNTPMVLIDKKPRRLIRKLTPNECAKLQGFPEWWTDGIEGSDSAKYKMWGNGIAIPCAADVIGRLVKELEKEGY
jgi:site-specific DNA-cytosine methylase